MAADSAGPTVDGHAQQRWDERAPSSAPAPETCWREGISLDPRTAGYDCHELRYHRETEMVLLRHGAEIKTVLWAFGNEGLARAVHDELRRRDRR
jgi:hypothetical protein